MAGAGAPSGVPAVEAYRTAGPAGLISKRRSNRCNRWKPEALRRAVHQERVEPGVFPVGKVPALDLEVFDAGRAGWSRPSLSDTKRP